MFKRGWDTLLPSVPLLTRLPYGGWWLAWDDLIDDLIFTGAYEPGEWRFVSRFLREGMIVVDVGAHHGFYTILAARRVGMSGRVIAFEPSPTEYRKLMQHLKLNRLSSRVWVFPYALSSEEGEATLFVSMGRRNSGLNSLRSLERIQSGGNIIVQTMTLDNFAKIYGINKIDFVKVDAEGAELEVLKGAKGIIRSKPRPVIMSEIQDSTTTPWGYRAHAIYDFLAERGYSWFSITLEGNLRRCPRREWYETPNNLVAIPEERFPQVIDLMTEQ